MDYQQLRTALAPSAGTVTLNRDTLGASFGDLLSTWNQGQALAITNAAAGPGDGENDAVVLTGRGSLLNVADLPVTARFSVEADGKVKALVSYQLRDDAPGPNAWTFSRSFPALPTVWNNALGVPTHEDGPALASQQKPYVDSLDLFHTCYVVSTHAQNHPELGVPLQPGINVVSRMRPQGMVGVLEAALTSADPVTLYGTVRAPGATETTRELLPYQRPWERPDAPGLHLRSELPLSFKVGKLVFDQAALRVYTPHSAEWRSQNGSFAPLHGYTGRLSIPSADVSVDLSASLEWGLARTFLFAKCQGVTLRKLSQLVDLAGNDSLTALLPSELQQAVEGLEKLELMDVGLGLALSGATPTVNRITAIVGFPSLEWKVWDDHLKVNGLACRFEVSRPFTPKATYAVTVTGTMEIEGVPVSISARSDSGFTLYAMLDGAQKIPLASLMKTYAPGLPGPSDLTVSTLAVSLSPGKSYSMSTRLAGKPKPWTLPVGFSNLVINDVVFDFKSAKGGQTTGSFSGSAALGKAFTLDVKYAVPGGFVMRGALPKANLTQLVQELCDVKATLPGGFDVVLENASVLIQEQNGNYTFRAATEVDNFGAFAFEARKLPGKGWGFAAGLDMGTAGLSQLAGLSGLKSIEDSFKLRKLMVLASSFEDAGFTFPDLAQFNQPQLSAGKLSLPAQATGVIPGLMLFAEWQLDANSKEQKLLKTLLGLGDTQSATLAIGADPMKDFRLYVSQKSSIQKQPFDCKFGVQLSGGKPSFFLVGTLTAKIQGHPQTFDVETLFVPGGAFLAATMKGATAVDCGPFKLSNLALQIGVDWAGIPSLGIAANIDVKNFSSSVAVFFDSTDPSRSLVAGSISSLTAKDVVQAFAGGVKTPLDGVLDSIAIKGTHEFTLPADVGDSLDALAFDKVATAFAAAKMPIPSSSQQLTLVTNTKGSSWHLTDLSVMRHYELERKGNQIQARVSPQFYFAPQPTSIGTLKYPQAFYINAALSFAGFDASATVDISPNKGFSVEAQMDKITLLDEKLFSVAALQGGGGPKISISTFSQPANPVKEFQAPHFYVNGSLTLLGVKKGVYASVSEKGIDFDLVGELVPGVKFDLDARFGKTGLGANGQCKVGVGTIDLGALGKAKINTDLTVEVDLDLDLGVAAANAGGAKDAVASVGTGWSAGQTVLENSLMTFAFQGDGNLVLYKHTSTGSQAVWASNTNGKGGTQLSLQGDGNLVIYTAQGKPVWGSGTNGKGVQQLKLQTDGNVVLYDGSGHPKWATGTNASGAQGETGASIVMESGFDFAGQHVKIERFKLAASADTFTRLPTIISKKVEDALRDVFKDATKWANAVSNGVMDGVNDTSKVLQSVYGKSEKEAKALANSASKGVNTAVNTVGDAAKDTGKALSKGVKKVKFW